MDLTYTMMVTPTLPQPRVYDLCGQTHDLIFDLSIQRTNELIAQLLEVNIKGSSASICCCTVKLL